MIRPTPADIAAFFQYIRERAALARGLKAAGLTAREIIPPGDPLVELRDALLADPIFEDFMQAATRGFDDDVEHERAAHILIVGVHFGLCIARVTQEREVNAMAHRGQV